MLRQWRNDLVHSEKTSARNLPERRRFNRAVTWHNDVTRHLSSPLRGGAKKSFKALCNLMIDFFDGKDDFSPWHGGPVDEETEPIIPTLKAIANTGVMITIEGQPGVCKYVPHGRIRDNFVTQLTNIIYKHDGYKLTLKDKSPAQVGDWVVFNSKNTKVGGNNEFYIALDYDLKRVLKRWDTPTAKRIKHWLNYIKIPAPAILFSPEAKFYPIFF